MSYHHSHGENRLKLWIEIDCIKSQNAKYGNYNTASGHDARRWSVQWAHTEKRQDRRLVSLCRVNQPFAYPVMVFATRQTCSEKSNSIQPNKTCCWYLLTTLSCQASAPVVGMLNDNRMIDYRNLFSFSFLHYRFSKCVLEYWIDCSRKRRVAWPVC